MNTMSIDPSVRSCGWAVWKNKSLKDFGVMYAANTKEKDWQQSGEEIGNSLRDKAVKWKVEKVYCEFPAYFGDNVAAHSGSLVKLSWMVGFLNGLFIAQNVSYELVRVNDWKGQLPKNIVQMRIARILPKNIIRRLNSMRSDAYDAVGIGLFIHGRMK